MSGWAGKIRSSDEESWVRVRRKSAEMLNFQRIGVSWGLSGRCIGRVDGQKR